MYLAETQNVAVLMLCHTLHHEMRTCQIYLLTYSMEQSPS